MSSTRPSLTITLDGARRVLDAALAKADDLGVAVSLCILDSSAHQVLAARMDQASLMTVDIAADKAHTVAALGGLPSGSWWPALEGRPGVLAGLNKVPRFSVLAGGVPITVDGHVVGAIAVSGASPEEDVLIAETGAGAVA